MTTTENAAIVKFIDNAVVIKVGGQRAADVEIAAQVDRSARDGQRAKAVVKVA